ncbi:MAG: tripartite tricarboxylate transporter TctB family protein [Gammaproteobacteria bacterium]
MASIIEIVALFVALGMGAMAATRLADPVATSPWIVPLIVSSAIALVSIALLIGEVRDRLKRRAKRLGADAVLLLPRSTPMRVAGWLALSSGYGVATPLIGFEWATAIFLPVALRTFGRPSWAWTIGLTAGMALLLPLVFRYVFQSLVP